MTSLRDLWRQGGIGEVLRRIVGPAGRFDHLADLPDATPADRAAFDAYAKEWTAHLGVILPLFVLACLLLWWPIDALVAPDARTVDAFAFMRRVSLVFLVTVAVAFRFSPVVQRHAFWFASVAYAAAMAIVGYSLGRLGGPDLSWLGDAYLAVLPAAMIPMPLGARIIATVVITAALPAAYFLPFPANWEAPAASSQVSFAGFAAAMSVLVGETVLRTVRRSFLQGRAVERARAEVEALASSLSSRVEEQTEELRALANHLEHTQEAERRRLSRDLHDELGQDLTAMRYVLQIGERRVADTPTSAAELLSQLTGLLGRTTQTVRALIMGLRPRLLEDEGLLPALEWLATRARESELEVVVVADPRAVEGLSSEAQVAVFRCVQEATTNVMKHAEARRLEIRLRMDGVDVVAEVVDDGVGFVVDAPRLGFGLVGMRERIRAVGGQLAVHSQPAGGARIVARVPSAPRNPSQAQESPR